MRQIQSTISAKYQTVIPAPIRKKLDLSSGEQLIWRVIYVASEPKIIAEPKPKSWAAYMKGLGKSIWQDVDIEEYVKNLRKEWQEEP